MNMSIDLSNVPEKETLGIPIASKAIALLYKKCRGESHAVMAVSYLAVLQADCTLLASVAQELKGGAA
ncbi:hypothetical protein ABXJ76_15080 [Methylobacter sp. G7]|uniref:hypothetical protein n=1 Tax=Methylobacter sp. G7 TaxID=3230117 RepID=UPI003D808071